MRRLGHIFQEITGGKDGQGIDWLAYLVIVAGVTVWFLMMPETNGALKLVLLDPDNYMRLVEVRDWLGGQSWWDVTQYRIDPPNGLRMHWSRLADVPLGLAISFFALFFERGTAEIIAAVGLPPVLLLFTAVFLGRAARNVGGAPAETWMRFLLISAIFVLLQFLPGRLDHHGLQLMLFAAALAAATGEPTRRSGLWVAFATAISLLIGLESVLLLLAIPAWMALNYLVGGRERVAQLEGFAIGIAIFLPGLYALSVAPSEWGRATYDEIGRGHIAMVVVGGVALSAAVRAKPASLGRRMLALGLVGFVAILPLAAFPEVATSPYSEIDPMLRKLWIDGISETKSAATMANESPFELLKYYLFPGLALLAGLWLYLTNNRPPKLLLILLVSVIGFTLSLWQLRGMAMASLTAVLLSALVGSHLWAHRARRFGHAYVAVAVALLNGWTGSFLFAAVARERSDTAASDDIADENQCENLLRRADHDRMTPGLVLGGTNVSGAILASTPHSVLAASNHRAVDSNRIAYRIFLSPTRQARAELVRSKIDYVLNCRDPELQRLANFAPDSFAADLQAGRIPGWLTPLRDDAGNQLGYYAVASD